MKSPAEHEPSHHTPVPNSLFASGTGVLDERIRGFPLGREGVLRILGLGRRGYYELAGAIFGRGRWGV